MKTLPNLCIQFNIKHFLSFVLVSLKIEIALETINSIFFFSVSACNIRLCQAARPSLRSNFIQMNDAECEIVSIFDAMEVYGPKTPWFFLLRTNELLYDSFIASDQIKFALA